jgi:glyoxylase-like metal-dependent hydrolase (beta-lactamase superfamily II)
MSPFLCVTCGTQFAPTQAPPPRCPVCEDERQYVPAQGQQWTTLEQMRQEHKNAVRAQELGLSGIGTEPRFAIGQRALLLRAPGGNVLWDCISLLDEATVEAVKALGGLTAIAISHPHYYSSMVEWSQAFGGAPTYLHAADRQWVMRPDPAIIFWEGETRPLGEGLTLVRCGGHFEGGTVLHWAAGAEGRGALLSGDILQVCPDRRQVSFMRSYPNYIPLSADVVRRVVKAVEPFAYDRIYGAWWDNVIASDARAAVARSTERYLRAIGAT